MTTAAPVIPDSSPIVLEKAEIRSWKAPIAFGVFVVLSLILFFGFPRHGQSTFRFSEKSDAIQLSTLTVDTFSTTIVVTLLLVVLTAVSAWLSWQARKTPIWMVIVFALLFVLFDVETLFVYPWAVTAKGLGPIAVAEMAVFLAILFLGLAYAWAKGALQWEE